MKKFWFTILLAAAVALFSSGCSLKNILPLSTTSVSPVESTPVSDPTETTVQTTASPEPTLRPVEEDVFYFANTLEYDRLYSMRRDGDDLTLILDERVYNVQQEDDSVYFIDNDQSLCFYHIPTGERRTLIDRPVQNYDISGTNLVYAISHTDENGQSGYFSSDVMYRSLADGTETLVAVTDIPQIIAEHDSIYYTSYYAPSQTTRLVAYDISQRQERILVDSVHGLGSLFPVHNGVYFVEYGQDQHWFFAAADGSAVQQLEDTLDTDAMLTEISEDGFLYTLAYDYINEIPGGVFLTAADGSTRALISAQGSEHFMCYSLPGGQYLITSVEYVGWGEKDEWDNYASYYTDYGYYLLDADKNVHAFTPGDITAQLFKDGDFPLLDSSTARKPITADLYSLFVKNHGYEGAEPLCSTTHGAWVNIADRKVDMALLAAPTAEEEAYLAEKGVEVEMKLYGGDGLVFIGNEANPVDDLTHEQILAIYRGEITNWSELGGPDHPISVYYRDDQSGSQRLFESLVFKGEELPDYEKLGFYIMDDMSSIVDICLYDPWAIGYSIMTYLEDVYANEDLKVFSVNGAIPSAQTVKSKAYPYNTQGYLVIRSDEPDNSPARRLFNWFGCAMSNDILVNNSVTPLSDDIVEPITD